MKPGTIVDQKYELNLLLGRGGNGAVYNATQRSTGQQVAIKLLATDHTLDPQKVERRRHRFLREMKICAHLNHPDIVGLIDFGEHEGSPYSVFELIRGRPLSQILEEQGTLPVHSTYTLMRQLLVALDYAHGQGVIHRDLKPSNLMVLNDELTRLKILDFGISSVRTQPMGPTMTRLTLTHELVGTPAYAAPEQLRGDTPTAKTDLYAWGLVLLECLTGTNPLAAGSVGEIFQKQLSPSPVEIPQQLQTHAIGTILRWVLNKTASRRASSAAHVLQRFEALDVTDLANEHGYLTNDIEPQHGHGHRPHHHDAPVTTTLDIRGERHSVSALCCRLALTSDSPVESALLDAYQSDLFLLCRNTVEEFGGTYVSGLGEFALFYFGVPRTSDSDSRRAVRAALELSARIRLRNATLIAQSDVSAKLQIGLHTGDLWRTPGAELFDTHCGTALLACTLASISNPSDTAIQVSDAFRAVAERFANFDTAGSSHKIQIPWLVETIESYPLTQESFSDLFQGERVPFVGRNDELSVLVESWRSNSLPDSNRRPTPFVLIHGEAGVGKSRLCYEFQQVASLDGQSVVALRFSPETEHIALQPLLNFLLERIGVDRHTSISSLELRSKLEAFDTDVDTITPLLCSWMSIPLESPLKPLPYSPQRQRAMLHDFLAGVVLEQLERKNAYLLVEDAHWADPSSQFWLESLLAQLSAKARFAIITARPQFTPSWASQGVDLQLLPLASNEIKDLVVAVHPTLSSDQVHSIVLRADGVPLFAEELARVVARQITSDSSHSVPLDIPPSLRDLMMSRLDALDSAKISAQYASAIGREFDVDLLAQARAVDEATVLGDLDQLISAGLIVRHRSLQTSRFFFRHTLIRDAAYHLMTPASRRVVHQTLADTWAAVIRERSDIHPADVARHYALADNPGAAHPFWLEAIDRAIQSHFHQVAMTVIETGLQGIASLPDGSFRNDAELDLLHRKLAALAIKHGGAHVEEHQAVYQRLSAILDDYDSSSARGLLARYQLWMVKHVTPDQANAWSAAQELVDLTQQHPSIACRLAGIEATSRTAFFMGRFDAVEHAYTNCCRQYEFEQANTYHSALGGDPFVNCVSFAAIADIICGRVDHGVDLFRKAIEHTRKTQMLGEHAGVLATSGALFLLRNIENGRYIGDIAPVVVNLQESIELSSKYDFPMWGGLAQLTLAILHTLASPQPSIDALQGLAAALTASEPSLGASLPILCVAEGLGHHGDPDTALNLLDRIDQYCDRSGEHFARAKALDVRAATLLTQSSDHTSEAQRYLDAAIELAYQQGADLFLLRSTLRLATLLEPGACEASLAKLRERWQHREGIDLPSVSLLFS